MITVCTAELRVLCSELCGVERPLSVADPQWTCVVNSKVSYSSRRTPLFNVRAQVAAYFLTPNKRGEIDRRDRGSLSEKVTLA